MISQYARLICLFFLLVVPLTALSGNDIDQHRSCTICGMDRKAYGYSRMLIQYEDGSTIGVCSLHCAFQYMLAHTDTPVKNIFVADRSSHSLIDARQAVWVIGGSKRGVMTKVPKWAFETQASAENFIKAYGGKIVTWEEVLAAAQEEAEMDKQR
jgi:copper chaperone NosL